LNTKIDRRGAAALSALGRNELHCEAMDQRAITGVLDRLARRQEAAANVIKRVRRVQGRMPHDFDRHNGHQLDQICEGGWFFAQFDGHAGTFLCAPVDCLNLSVIACADAVSAAPSA
jgi:hypothetical protein